MTSFTKGSPEIYTQLRPPVVPGPLEALPEPDIYVRLAEAMQLVPPPPAQLLDRHARQHDAPRLDEYAPAASGPTTSGT